jgi:hypothetical protein
MPSDQTGWRYAGHGCSAGEFGRAKAMRSSLTRLLAVPIHGFGEVLPESSRALEDS